MLEIYHRTGYHRTGPKRWKKPSQGVGISQLSPTSAIGWRRGDEAVMQSMVILGARRPNLASNDARHSR